MAGFFQVCFDYLCQLVWYDSESYQSADYIIDPSHTLIMWGVVLVALSNMVCGLHNLAVCAPTWREQGLAELMVKHGLDVSGPANWRNAFQCVPGCVCIICCTVRDFDPDTDRFHNRAWHNTHRRSFQHHVISVSKRFTKTGINNWDKDEIEIRLVTSFVTCDKS